MVQPGPVHSLVTGGSRGIGAAITRTLAARGDRVAVHCRGNVAAAEQLLASLPGEGHFVVTGDVADPAAVEAMAAQVVARFGTVDVLVNNAGIYEHQPFAEMSYADWQLHWRRTVDVNLIGAANVTWQVARHLLDRPAGPRGGRIVNVGSRGAFRGEPEAPAYGAAKAGLHSLTGSLAVALAPHGITVSAVAPGFVATDMAETLLAGPAGDAIRAQSPFGRVARPDEVAAVVAFLSGPGSEWCSGTVVDANGASYLR